jgi:hypothetical protein
MEAPSSAGVPELIPDNMGDGSTIASINYVFM